MGCVITRWFEVCNCCVISGITCNVLGIFGVDIRGRYIRGVGIIIVIDLVMFGFLSVHLRRREIYPPQAGLLATR